MKERLDGCGLLDLMFAKGGNYSLILHVVNLHFWMAQKLDVHAHSVKIEILMKLKW